MKIRPVSHHIDILTLKYFFVNDNKNLQDLEFIVQQDQYVEVNLSIPDMTTSRRYLSNTRTYTTGSLSKENADHEFYQSIIISFQQETGTLTIWLNGENRAEYLLKVHITYTSNAIKILKSHLF